MQRVRDVIGKPIVSTESGAKLGTAADLLLNADGEHIAGIVLRGGILATETVLPYSCVERLGRDVIVARTSGDLLTAREWRDRGVDAVRCSRLDDRVVVSGDGRRVGTIKDVYVDEATGAVHSYEVGKRRFARRAARGQVNAQSDGVRIGRDVVVVSSETADRLSGRDGQDGAARSDGPT